MRDGARKTVGVKSTFPPELSRGRHWAERDCARISPLHLHSPKSPLICRMGTENSGSLVEKSVDRQLSTASDGREAAAGKHHVEAVGAGLVLPSCRTSPAPAHPDRLGGAFPPTTWS